MPAFLCACTCFSVGDCVPTPARCFVSPPSCFCLCCSIACPCGCGIFVGEWVGSGQVGGLTLAGACQKLSALADAGQKKVRRSPTLVMTSASSRHEWGYAGLVGAVNTPSICSAWLAPRSPKCTPCFGLCLHNPLAILKQMLLFPNPSQNANWKQGRCPGLQRDQASVCPMRTAQASPVLLCPGVQGPERLTL